MLSSWRELGRFVFGKQRDEHKHTRPSALEGKARLRAAASTVLEDLEGRLLLAVIPAPLITGHQSISGGGDNRNYSQPSIAYNPSDPQKLVTVYSRFQPGVNGRQKVFVEGSFSTDGGATWAGFGMGGNLPNWTLTGGGDHTLQRATDASVAFDRNDNFYVVYVEHDDDDAAGAVVMQKFDFSGGTPNQNALVTDRILYDWVGQDSALTPMLAVDNNLASYQDPQTGDIQSDPWAGNVYVAWTTNNTAPTNAPNNFNANAIKLMASSDGGLTFSTQQLVNNNPYAGHHMTSPKLVVSQGTAADLTSGVPRVAGGQVTIVWDDFTGTGGGGNDTDIILTDRVTDGAIGIEFPGAVGPILEAVDPGNNAPHTPTDNDFLATVAITDTPEKPFVLTDLDVSVALAYPALAELRIQLISPPLPGFPQGRTITLVRNGVDATGTNLSTAQNPRGLTGNLLGVVNLNDLGTVFDSDASRNIVDPTGVAPWIAHFRPETGSLAVFAGLTPAELNGDWTLRVTDFRAGSTPAQNDPAPEVRAWEIQMTSNLTTGPDANVANTRVRGALTGPYPLKPAVNPTQGVGPAPTIASDNTLGSFSQFQGRLYISYVGKGSNTSDDTDIFLLTSDDGGVTWTPGLLGVNDDGGPTDGFSEGNRAQFQPSIAVDQLTGTLAMSWYDGRYDAARSRVATFMGFSIDGGATFAPQTYANTPNTVVDAITGNPINLEPIPDNQSAGNGVAEGTFSFGNNQGLAIVGGHVIPVWSGNLNEGTGQTPLRLQIFTADVRIAAGPRVTGSTMGPVSLVGDNVNPADADGTTQLSGFEIQFDRPIDPAAFTVDDVTLLYGDVLGNDPEAIAIGSVTPLDYGFFGPAGAEGATLFLVTLETPERRVGTYSYFLSENINDRVRNSLTISDVTIFSAEGANTNMDIPPVGDGGSGDPVQDITDSVITVAGLPDVIASITVRVDIEHTVDSDLIITLVAPDGTSVILSNLNGDDADFLGTRFDDTAFQAISAGFSPFQGAYRPDESLNDALAGLDGNGDWHLLIEDTQAGEVGVLLGWSLFIKTGAAPTPPTTTVFPADPSELGQIFDGTTPVISTITVSGMPVGQVITSMQLKLSIDHTYDGDVFAALIAPTGDFIILKTPSGDPGINFTDTIFDDAATVDIFNGTAPFTGSFRPEDPLSTFNGIDPNGDWLLFLDDVFPLDDDGQLIDWQLIITTDTPGSLGVNGNLIDQNGNSIAGEAAIPGITLGDIYAAPRPTQNNSFDGTGFNAPYDHATLPLIVPGPHVVSTIIAGSTQTYVPEDDQLNLDIPPVGTGGSGVFDDDTTISTLTIDAPNEVVQHLSVNLTVTHTLVSDLVIHLIAPDGTSILLVDGGFDGLDGEDFINTTFDDTAGQFIFQGTAPFTGRFRPDDFAGLDSLAGLDLSGDWTLQIEDIADEDVGTLVNWSLTNGAISSNLGLNQTVSNVDVTFDRDMDPASITPASVLRMMGPQGQITGPFTITPDPNGDAPDPLHPRTFRVGFPTQQYSGTYTIQLAPTILSADGDALDTNLNAGLYLLDPSRAPTTATIPILFSTSTPAPIGDTRITGKVTNSTITISDDFLIEGTRLKLNITYLNDPDLEAVLIAPFDDPNTGLPLEIKLFSGVGSAGTRRNFQQTEFDDLATTPIQNGGAPFFGKFNPQEPLSALTGHSSAGTWTLRITDNVSGRTGTLTGWSLTFDKPVPQSGLGETSADQAQVSFRIFTMDPADPLSHTVWTAVGGASNNAQGNSSRIGGLAVDPSDPSGNTVYVGGASGGIWKTTNFMSAGLEGPTYIPLTDFGPTFAINIGGIAVFGRSSDTNRSIIFGGTGEGDTANNVQRSAGGSSGVGFIRSMDGGATWQLLDSTTNVDAAGNLLPISATCTLGQTTPCRDHIFVGTAAFDVVVDPRPTPTGEVIVYAAMTGFEGGIWRSLDSGNHWQKMRAGDATDVQLDYNSGAFDTFSNPTGNVQLIYAGFRGEGVFLSPNRGQVWNQMLGTVGNPLIQDNTGRPTTRPVTVSPKLPNGAKGRIVLTAPALTGDPIRDVQYEGWLYAGVVGTDEHMDGLYVTKDFGQNWTLIRLPTIPNNAGRPITGIPTNDASRPDYDVGGGGDFAQGNYDVAIGIDPTNPNIVYLGGTFDGQATGLIRIDATGLSDPHALYLSNSRNDGGARWYNSGDSIGINHANPPDIGTSTLFPNAMIDVCGTVGFGYCGPYINLIRDPQNVFLGNATIGVINVNSWTNSGLGATWIPFDIEGTDHHRWVTMVDPITGLPRLIVGDDQGLFTAVDENGVFNTGVGLNGYGMTDFSRNGNLQINQFYYGATQPSGLAAQIGGALFYGQAQDNGSLQSDPNLLENGNIIWVGPEGDGAGIATDQTGSGTLYRYNWPCCGGDLTNFFSVNGIGRTFGLLQDSQGGNTPDPQWPFLGGSTFAVNPINKDQIIMSSIVSGRIFGTTNQGRFWTEIGSPTALDGTYAPGVAYGAPDPAGPGGSDTTNFFLYAGTEGGHVYVTYNGGGALGNNWRDISAGLDGSTVHVIATDPQRGTHDAYAVTTRGVYFMADSTVAAPVWVNITGNLFNITANAFGDPNFTFTQMKALTSIAADWRYTIADSTSPNSGSHPIIYVGGEGGVYRSLDKGTTWSLFPDPTADGAPIAGGFLPNAHVSDLDIALGNIDPTTGMPDVASGPDVLVATTYGRGAFAIRLAPLVVPGTVRFDPADDTGISNTDRITKVSTPRIFGNSAMTAFGNTVRITLVDLTDPNNPVVVGGYDGTPATDIAANWTDVQGRFSLRIDAGAFNTDGLKRIGVHASDESGTVSNDTIITFTLDTTNPVGVSQAITPIEASAFTGVVAVYPNEPAIGSATINWGDGSSSNGTIVANLGGGFAVRGTHTYQTPGSFAVTVSATDAAGNAGVTDSTATVSNPAVSATGGVTFNAKQNSPATGTVATFTDAGGPEALTHYSASINWGDGFSSAGTITLNGSTFTVAGTHTYTTSASFTITVTISHTTNAVAAPDAVVTSTAVVALPDLVGTGGFAITGSEGTASGSVVVATFTDPGPAQVLGAYSAQISWGDGTTSAGTITLNAGTYSVAGNHTYSIPGSFTISTDITRTTSTITVQSSANISNPAVVASGGPTFSAAKGINSPSQTVATFTDPGGPETVGTYVATIDWGDGGPTSTGTITNNSGVYTVAASHNYGATGSFTITVTIAHTQNSVAAPSAVVTTSATVMLPPVTMTGGFTFIAAEGSASSSQTVATFKDDPTPDPVGNYVADIDWGDGTSSTGTITFNSGSKVFTVKQSHTYSEEGSYTIRTTIHHAGALDASVNSTATVSDQAVVGTGGFTVDASRGVLSSSQTVATFIDPAGPEALNEYSASINWGDGRTSAGVISFNAGVFTVAGEHLYNTEGQFTISVTLSHGTAPNRTVTSTAIVLHPPLIVTGGLTYDAVEGQTAVDQPVATFIDPVQGSEAITSFSATISWGDGTSSAAVITVDTATRIFTVRGTHKYTEEGTKTITVTIHHSTAPDATVTSTAVIADPAVVPTGGLTVNGTEAVAFTNKTVATFTDPGGAEPLADYSATINWGDGNSSAGTITFNSTSKVFSVAGGHTYADGGTYTITTTIHHDTAPNASANSTGQITDAPVNATGGFTFTAVEGALSSLQTVATFKDVGTPKPVGDYNVEIDWGDNSTSAGTVSFNAGTSVFTVRGQHTYPAKKTYTISVTISHGTAPEKTVSSTANVANAPVTVTAASLPAVNEGATFSGTIGSFVDGNPAGVASMFSASINWGDGASSTGTIVASGGGFTVSGQHVFADGTLTRTVTLTVHDIPANEDFSKTASIQVNNVKPVASIDAPASVFRGSNANFSLSTDDAATDLAAGFTYSINWGDGSAVQTITRTAGNDERVVGHTFNNTSSNHVTVRATDKDGAVSDVAAIDVVPEIPPTLTSSTINNGLKMRSRITDVDFTLSADAGVALSDLKLMRGNVAVSLASAGFTYDAGSASGHLDMRHVKLDNANYDLLINTGAGNLHVAFSKLAGDTNGDLKVNKKDLNAVKKSLNKVAGQAGYRANADITSNGKVDKKDLKVVKKNLKKKLPPP